MRIKAELMDEAALSRTLIRIAHQIIEKNSVVEDLCLIGIRSRGVPLAKRIQKNILDITGVEVPVGALDITLYRDDLSTIAEKPGIQRLAPGAAMEMGYSIEFHSACH